MDLSFGSRMSGSKLKRIIPFSNRLPDQGDRGVCAVDLFVLCYQHPWYGDVYFGKEWKYLSPVDFVKPFVHTLVEIINNYKFIEPEDYWTVWSVSYSRPQFKMCVFLEDREELEFERTKRLKLLKEFFPPQYE